MRNEEEVKIKHFTDLISWKYGRALVTAVYESANTFPVHEQYALTSQIKRAVVSITSNIAEGFRRDTMKDKIRFYVMAHGSLSEVQNQLYVAFDVGYITETVFNGLYAKTEAVDKALSGLIRASKVRL